MRKTVQVKIIGLSDWYSVQSALAGYSVPWPRTETQRAPGGVDGSRHI